MKNNIFKTAQAFILLILVSFNLFAQPGRSWSFGGKYHAFIHTASAPLTVRMSGAAMLGELSFVSRVGGVAFHAIATPASDFYVASNLRIDYMRYKLDGQRLIFTMLWAL